MTTKIEFPSTPDHTFLKKCPILNLVRHFRDFVEDTLEIPLVESTVGEWGVVGGAALVLRGVRDSTRDVDIVMADELFDQLVSHGISAREYCYPWSEDSDFAITCRKITPDNYTDIFTMNSMRARPEFVYYGGSFRIQTLNSIIVEKSLRHREKDIADIKLISAYLSKERPDLIPR